MEEECFQLELPPFNKTGDTSLTYDFSGVAANPVNERLEYNSADATRESVRNSWNEHSTHGIHYQRGPVAYSYQEPTDLRPSGGERIDQTGSKSGVARNPIPLGKVQPPLGYRLSVMATV